jgi:hypothetical protein
MNGEPSNLGGGATSWMTAIFQGMEKRASFRCPSAGDHEVAKNVHAMEAGKLFDSSYGMYRGWSTGISSMIQRPEQSIVIAETSGGPDAFNPKPFKSDNDGVVIGWDTGNFEAEDASDYVTRLAFGGTSGGQFDDAKPGRHDIGIHVLLASGKLGRIRANEARIKRMGSRAGSQIVGNWATN